MSGLMPREHGAYAQLGFPVLTGLVYSGGHPGAIAFTVVAIALFLAHEPLGIAMGVRGKRLQAALGDAARRRILFLAGAALGGLLAAIGLAGPRAWMSAVLPGGLALLLLPAVGTRRMKSIPAEIIAATVFSTTVLPLALTGDAALYPAARAAAVWFGATLPAIYAVHAIKAALRKRPEERWLLRAAPIVAGGVAVAYAAGAFLLPDALDLLAAVPPALAALVNGLRPPHPRHLKRVGWAMVASYVVAFALLLLL